MEIIHSCCPGKRDIYAPVFVKKEEETMHLAKGDMEVYDCKGCRTIIMVYVPKIENV